MKYRVKKWAKQIVLRMIHLVQARPAIKSWVCGGLKGFPALEARLRGLSGNQLLQMEGALPTIAPITRAQLTPRAARIHDGLVASITQHAGEGHS